MAETEIEIPSRTGLRGRIERLAHEYMLKASALKITIEVLDEDDRKTALSLAPKKFLQAMNHRSSSNGVVTTKTGVVRKSESERRQQIVDYLTDHDGASSTEIGAAIGVSNNTVARIAQHVATAKRRGSGGLSFWTLKKKHAAAWTTVTAPDDGAPLAKIRRKPQKKALPLINGKRMSLFVLEHLSQGQPRQATDLLGDLAAAGSPVNPKAMNGILGAVGKPGWVKRHADGGYTLTRTGAAHHVALRKQLEASGRIEKGGYTAP